MLAKSPRLALAGLFGVVATTRRPMSAPKLAAEVVARGGEESRGAIALTTRGHMVVGLVVADC